MHRLQGLHHVSALPERESLPLEEALEFLLQRTPTVAESEEVPLFDADGRICFAHMRAELPQPPYNRVQVDGYALRSSDIASATAERPAMGIDIKDVLETRGQSLPA